jgi:hypothetical protein
MIAMEATIFTGWIYDHLLPMPRSLASRLLPFSSESAGKYHRGWH